MPPQDWEWMGSGKAREVSGTACPDAPQLSPHGMGDIAALSLLPAPKRRPRKVSPECLRKSFQEPELFLSFDQSPASFCMRGGGEPICYTCHKLFLDH